MRVEVRSAQPISLPLCVVRILNRQVGERYRLAALEGLIDEPELVQQHAE